MTAKGTAIFVPIAIASVSRQCLSLNLKEYSLRISLIRPPKNCCWDRNFFFKNKNGLPCFCAPCLHVGNSVPQVTETRSRLSTFGSWF